ncbi:IclR helix-turn-helix domain protein [compost metagenome]
MRKTQNKRTLHDISQYIKVANRDGVLKESMMTIASRTGYSNATVHRALQTLEERGIIRIVLSQSAKEPTTIYYQGPSNDDVADLLQRATYAMTELSRATQNVEEVMMDLRHHMSLMETNRPHIQVH